MLRDRKPLVEEELKVQKERDPEQEAAKEEEIRKEEIQDDKLSDQDNKTTASKLSRMRCLTKGFFKEYTPAVDVASYENLRSVDFSFNGLKYYVACADKIVKYQKEEHSKENEYVKGLEVEIKGVQNMKVIDNGDLAVQTYADGKNMMCFYDQNLEKLAAFDIRGSDSIEKSIKLISIS